MKKSVSVQDFTTEEVFFYILKCVSDSLSGKTDG